MAINTLTPLIQDIYAAMDKVSRELTGFLPGVSIDSRASQAAVGQSVRVPIEPAANVVNVTPAMTPPEPTGQTSTNAFVTITKSRAAEFGFDGEEIRALDSGSSAGYNTVRQGKIAQAIRALVNEVEADLAALHTTCSRAVGTPGTTPFGTSLADSALVRKVLDDNGAPFDRTLVIDTTAGANLRTLANLTDANRAGTTDVRALGRLIDLHGFAVRESAQIQTAAASAAAGWTVSGAHAVGATAITVAGGTGAFVAGDVVQFAGDANKYVVAAFDAATGTLTIANPGLRVAKAGAEAVTVLATSTRNVAFDRSAIVLAARAPEVPEGGDAAVDRTTLTDPLTGMTFEFAAYKGYRRERYEVALAWGVANIKPEHTALLLG